MRGLMVLAAAMVLGGVECAAAQDADVVAGKAYAEQVCSPCHAVRQGQEESPLFDAPSFQSVADTPGMTELALSVWMQSSHPTMPNLVLEQDDLRNVIAYIHSLKGKGAY